MKKYNNIDDLFARKLSDLERTPSPDLWKRIEQGQKKEARRLGGWYWYVAASVTILLMAGYLMWQNQMQSEKSQEQIAKMEKTVNPKADVKSPALPLNEKENLASEPKPKTVVSESELNSVLQAQALAKNTTDNSPKSPKSEPTPVLEDVKIAVVGKAEIAPEQLITRNDDMKTLEHVELPAIDPGKIVPDPQKRVVVAHIETEDGGKEDQKASKFLRVLRQLKNAKQGDEVEWDELGFNPKRILARADERLRTGEDKISDKYQELKNKTKL